MAGILAAVPSVMCGVSLRTSCRNRVNAESRHHFPNPVSVIQTGNCVSPLSIYPSRKGNLLRRKQHCVETSRGVVKSAASSVGTADENVEEPATSVKFQRSVTLPGCSTTLSLLGTGFREKKFAIIGVKVYAAGLYVNESILNGLSGWKGRSADEIQRDSSLFSSIFQDQSEKSLQIVLVRDVDGKTFWDALDEAISPRIKSPSSEDETALSTFRDIFQNRPLNKGSVILLTWINPCKMLVSVSSGGLPTDVDAAIESGNVTSALFDVFFGDSPVSPTLKSSVANQLAMIIKNQYNPTEPPVVMTNQTNGPNPYFQSQLPNIEQLSSNNNNNNMAIDAKLLQAQTQFGPAGAAAHRNIGTISYGAAL